MRFDCVKNLKLSCLKFHKDYVEINIPKSKTDQECNGQKAYLVSTGSEFDPYFLLCQYLYKFNELFGSSDEYLLPMFKYDSNLKQWKIDSNKMLTYSAAYKPFKMFLKSFGINPIGLSLHSMRIGGTTEDFARGIPDYLIDLRGRWRDPKTKKTYCKTKIKTLVKSVQLSYKN